MILSNNNIAVSSFNNEFHHILMTPDGDFIAEGVLILDGTEYKHNVYSFLDKGPFIDGNGKILKNILKKVLFIQTFRSIFRYNDAFPNMQVRCILVYNKLVQQQYIRKHRSDDQVQTIRVSLKPGASIFDYSAYRHL